MSASNGLPELPRMNFEQFIAWRLERPEGEKYELVDGQVVRLQAEREIHAFVKSLIAFRLFEAIRHNKLPCTVYVDGLVVRADDDQGFEPDVLVRCGPRPDPNALWIDDPMIVVEVLSPTTQGIDTSTKLAAYAAMPSVRHYLIVNPFKRSVVHHSRHESGQMMARIRGEAPITLDPPGLVLDDFFA